MLANMCEYLCGEGEAKGGVRALSSSPSRSVHLPRGSVRQLYKALLHTLLSFLLVLVNSKSVLSREFHHLEPQKRDVLLTSLPPSPSSLPPPRPPLPSLSFHGALPPTMEENEVLDPDPQENALSIFKTAQLAAPIGSAPGWDNNPPEDHPASTHKFQVWVAKKGDDRVPFFLLQSKPRSCLLC